MRGGLYAIMLSICLSVCLLVCPFISLSPVKFVIVRYAAAPGGDRGLIISSLIAYIVTL